MGGIKANADQTELWSRILGCSSHIGREINRRLRDRFGYSIARLHVLEALSASRKGMALSHLANALMVPQSNVTTLVNELVKIGHVRRVTAQADRRVQVALLTSAGRAILRRLRAERAGALSELLMHVPRRDVTRLLTDLTRFERTVSGNPGLDGKRRTARKRKP